MPSDSAKEATKKYKAMHIRRVALEMQREEYERLKRHAENAGETVNGYLKKAMRLRMSTEEVGNHV